MHDASLMTESGRQSDQCYNPALQRVWALIALMFDCLADPARRVHLDTLFAQAEDLLARLTFEGAARIAGRPDLLETHEAYVIRTNNSFDIRVRRKPGAIHPHHQIILAKWRAGRIARYRRALGRRSRFSRKLSYLHFRNQARTQGRILSRLGARLPAPSHAPARIAAPP